MIFSKFFRGMMNEESFDIFFYQLLRKALEDFLMKRNKKLR